MADQNDLSWLLNMNNQGSPTQVGAGTVLRPEALGSMENLQRDYMQSIIDKNSLNRGDLSFSENMLGTKDFTGRLTQGLGAAGSLYNIYSGITGAADAKSQFNKKMDFMDRDYAMRKGAYDTAQTQRDQRVASARGNSDWNSNALGSV